MQDAGDGTQQWKLKLRSKSICSLCKRIPTTLSRHGLPLLFTVISQKRAGFTKCQRTCFESLVVSDTAPGHFIENLVERHKLTGALIAPNANKVLRDLAGHSQELGFVELADVFRDGFDGDIRNGYAHAD